MVRLRLIALAFTLFPVAAMAQTAAPVPAAPAAANPASQPVTRAELPGLIKEAILNDPDIVMAALKKLHDQQAEKTKAEVKASFDKHKSELLTDTVSPSVGAKDADVTIVEFFDYHCGYCKQLYPSVAKLIGEDKKLRVVFREFPILSEDSVLASRGALAVSRLAPEKYFAYHSALMQASGKFDEKMLTDLAVKQGIKAAAFKAELAKQEITDLINKNRDLGDDMGIRGTPALVIGDQLVPGAVPYEDLKKMIADARGAAGKAPAAAKPAEPAKPPVAAPAPAPAKPVEAPKAPEAAKPAAPAPAPVKPAAEPAKPAAAAPAPAAVPAVALPAAPEPAKQ